MKYVFVLDETKCIACGACTVACMDQNDIETREGDVPFRSCFVKEQGEGREARFRFLSVSCMHCGDAPCISACPAGCIRRDAETGLVVCDNTDCIGCRSCASACPAAVPAFNGALGKMNKCDGCVERIRQGLKPACIKVCPFGALKLETEDE